MAEDTSTGWEDAHRTEFTFGTFLAMMGKCRRRTMSVLSGPLQLTREW